MIGELPSLGLWGWPVRAKPRALSAQIPQQVINAGDVSEALKDAWALPPSYLNALHGTLPLLVGKTIEQAQQQLAVAPQRAGRTIQGMIGILPISGVIYPRGGLANMLGLI